MKTLARFALVVLFGWSALALALPPQGSPTPSRGNMLRKPQYATQSALTLYVDPTGSDSNNCTAAGTAACLTIAGARALVPKLVQHPVIINLAAGTYAGDSIFAYSFTPATVAAGAYISFVGSQTAFTVATGTNSGTVTAVGTDSDGYSTVTDATQTWTASDLQGRFLAITGGTGSGQTLPIYENTGTMISVVGTYSPAPVAGSTYEIRTPAAVITTGVNQMALPGSAAGNPSTFNIGNAPTQRYSSTDANIAFTDIDFSPASGSRAMTLQQSTVSLLRCRVAGSNQTLFQLGSNSRLVANFVTMIGGSSGAGITAGRQGETGIALTLQRVWMKQTSSSYAILAASPNVGGAIGSSFRIDAGAAAGGGFASLQGGFGDTQVAGRIACAGTTPKGVTLTKPSLSGNSTGVFGISDLRVSGCGTAIEALGTGNIIFMRDGDLTSNTNGLVANYGGTIILGNGGVALSGNTNDVTVGSTVMTFAVFSALVPPAVTDLNEGSRIFLDTAL